MYTVPKPHPQEFRDDVVNVARNREPGQTIKQIAADFGISHHAVEKRLKMARTKLNATSSLEAARMLGEAEGYGRAVAQSPDLVSDALPLHSGFTRLAVLGVAIMILVGAIVLALLLQPATFSQAANNQPVGAPGEQVVAPGVVPAAGTEAALRTLVAGLASGSPDYEKLSPRFAEVVRRDLPTMQPLFRSMGELRSVTFRGRGDMADDVDKLCLGEGRYIVEVAKGQDHAWLRQLFPPSFINWLAASTPPASSTPGSRPSASATASRRWPRRSAAPSPGRVPVSSAARSWK